MRKRARPDRWLALAALAWAASGGAQTAAGPKLLPAEQAFRLSGRAIDARTVEARFNVADGYYLYRDKLRFAVDPAPASAGKPELPPGKPHEDEFFGKVTIYRGLAVVRIPVAAAAAGQDLTLVVDSQGCADAGVCYPPQVQRVPLKLPRAGAGPSPAVEAMPSKPSYFK
jgi:thiol:disulfide interchange protein DsbD